MTRWTRAFCAAMMILCAPSAFAQDATVPAAAPQAAADMSQVAIGDHWNYDIIDDITGEVKEKRTWLVTDLSPKDITCRVELAGSAKFGSVVYDTSWNIVRNGEQRFSPHDFSGLQLPLDVGKSWSFQANRIDTTGQVWKKTGESRVTGKETVATKAGSFDTFVIDTKFAARNNNDAARKAEVTTKLWLSPTINHWVKRTTVSSENGHIVQKTTLELTSYGRRKT